MEVQREEGERRTSERRLEARTIPFSRSISDMILAGRQGCRTTHTGKHEAAEVFMKGIP